MKTMKLGDTIKRVKDKEVTEMLKTGWNYITKSEWKEKVRVVKAEKKKKKEKS